LIHPPAIVTRKGWTNGAVEYVPADSGHGVLPVAQSEKPEGAGVGEADGDALAWRLGVDDGAGPADDDGAALGAGLSDETTGPAHPATSARSATRTTARRASIIAFSSGFGM
jgi:hypothetical protein